MNDHATPDHRKRTGEDPWTVVLRVVHDLRRDGIRVHHADERMPEAVRRAAALLESLGVRPVIPEEGNQ